MENKYSEVTMLFAILPNIRICADNKIKGNKIYQITVGNKKNRNGMYIQVKNNEVMAKQGIFEGKPDCRLHFLSAKSLTNYCLHKKGTPIILGFYNPLNVLLFNGLLRKTINIILNKNNSKTEEEKNTQVRIYFNTILSSINELGKAGNEEILKWLKDSPKKTWSLEVKNNDDLKIWLTIQNGSSKVLLSQSTVLTSQCALKFNCSDDVIDFYNSDSDKRNSIIDNIVSVREDQVDKNKEVTMLKAMIEEAFKYL